jgi:hypothetical protein
MKSATTPRKRQTGERLRGLAARLCSADTLDRLVDPLIADMQHECAAADGRRGGRAWVRLRGYAAFWTALALHAVLVAGDHLARNAFGATPAERTFHRRAGLGTLAALAALTSVMMLVTVGTLVHSLVFLLTHQRWPGPPTVAEVLPSAIAIATDPRGLLNLIPSWASVTLPPSLLLGILLALGGRKGQPEAFSEWRRSLRGVGGLSVAATLFAIILTGWVVPTTGQRFREILVASISHRTDHKPVRESGELTLPELQASIRSEQLSGRSASATRYRVELHRRAALSAAGLVFALLGLGLAAQRRKWTTWQAGATAFGAAVVYDWGILPLSGRAVEAVSLSPFVGVWAPDIILGIAGVTLVVCGYRRESPPPITI